MASRAELQRREIQGLKRLLDRCDDERKGIRSRLLEIDWMKPVEDIHHEITELAESIR